MTVYYDNGNGSDRVVLHQDEVSGYVSNSGDWQASVSFPGGGASSGYVYATEQDALDALDDAIRQLTHIVVEPPTFLAP